jgi:hypothetical protein
MSQQTLCIKTDPDDGQVHDVVHVPEVLELVLLDFDALLDDVVGDKDDEYNLGLIL